MAATTAAEPSFLDETSYLLIRIAGDLAPNLAHKPQDRSNAMNMAWRMVKSYNPGSEAEVVSAARIVALSMTQLDLLRESTQADLTPAMKLRYVNAAVRVNREICNNERTLERRQLMEERRPIAQQPVEAERINRGSNRAAVDRAAHEALLEQMQLMRAAERQAAEAAPPPPAGSTPVADPVEPDEQQAPSPVDDDRAAVFVRSMAEARAHYHATLAAASPVRARDPAASPVRARDPGAGTPPPSTKAAPAG